HGHRTDSFSAERCDSRVTASFQTSDSPAFKAQQLAGRYFHVHQREFRGTPAVDRPEALQVEIGRMAIDHEKAHAKAIAWLARRARRDDQLIGPRCANHRGLGPTQDKIVSVTTRGGRNVVEIISRPALRPGQRPYRLAFHD